MPNKSRVSALLCGYVSPSSTRRGPHFPSLSCSRSSLLSVQAVSSSDVKLLVYEIRRLSATQAYPGSGADKREEYHIGNIFSPTSRGYKNMKVHLPSVCPSVVFFMAYKPDMTLYTPLYSRTGIESLSTRHLSLCLLAANVVKWALQLSCVS